MMNMRVASQHLPRCHHNSSPQSLSVLGCFGCRSCSEMATQHILKLCKGTVFPISHQS